MLRIKYIKEFKSLSKLAVPIIIGQLGVILMGVLDNVMIGQLIDKNALAAASIGNALSFLIGSLAFGGIPVIAPLFAQRNGKEKLLTLQISLEAVVILSLILTFLSILVFLIFGVFQQPEYLEKSAKSYFLLITISNIPLFIFLVFKQWLDSANKAEISMWVTFAGLAANAVLNYFFIEGIGSFKGMDLNGAGIATILTRCLMLVLIFYFIPLKVRQEVMIGLFANIRQHTERIIFQLKTILYSGVQVFFEIGAFAFAVIMMGWMSSTALAAHQIAVNIAAIMYMMATGVAYAAGIRVGNSLLKANFDDTRIAGTVALLLVFVMMLLSASFIFLSKSFLVALYIDDIEVQNFAVSLLVIAAFFQVSDGIQAVALGCLRGLTDVKVPAVLTFVAYWLISLPVGYFLAFKMDLQAEGVWYGLLIGLSIAAILLVNRFYTLLSKREKLT